MNKIIKTWRERAIAEGCVFSTDDDPIGVVEASMCAEIAELRAELEARTPAKHPFTCICDECTPAAPVVAWQDPVSGQCWPAREGVAQLPGTIALVAAQAAPVVAEGLTARDRFSVPVDRAFLSTLKRNLEEMHAAAQLGVRHSDQPNKFIGCFEDIAQRTPGLIAVIDHFTAAHPVAGSPAEAWKGLVDKAIAVLNRHIEPDGISDHDALNELYGIFDGPEYRAVADIAQDRCDARQQQEMAIDRLTANAMQIGKLAAAAPMPASEAPENCQDHPALVKILDDIFTSSGWAKYKADEEIALYPECFRDIFKAGMDAATPVPASEVATLPRLYRFDRINKGRVMAEGIGVHAASMEEAENKARKMMYPDDDSIKFRSNEPCHKVLKCAICKAYTNLAAPAAPTDPYAAITLGNLRAGKLTAARVYVGYCELNGELAAAKGAIKRYEAQADELRRDAAPTDAKGGEGLPPLPQPEMPHGSRDYFSAAQMTAYGTLCAEPYSDLIRAICFEYAAGGYNSEGLMSPKAADGKLRWIIDDVRKWPNPTAAQSVRDAAQPPQMKERRRFEERG